MYELTESAVFALIGAILGGFSLLAVATFFIIMEGLNAKFRALRSR